MAAGGISAHVYRLMSISNHMRQANAAGALSSAEGWREDACGVSLSGEPIPVYVHTPLRKGARVS